MQVRLYFHSTHDLLFHHTLAVASQLSVPIGRLYRRRQTIHNATTDSNLTHPCEQALGLLLVVVAWLLGRLGEAV